MSTSNPPSKDVLFDAIGSFGPWQKTVFAIVFYINTAGIWQNFAMTFLAPNVPFQCVDLNFTSDIFNETVSQFIASPKVDQCTVNIQFWSDVSGESWNETVSCKKWEYDKSQYSDTLVSQWDLVCNNEWLISLAKSVYMMGFLISVFTFGQVSDWIGRFPTMAICFLITVVSLILSPFSTSFSAFAIFRFLQALGRAGLSTTGYVLLMEIVGAEHRRFVGIAIQLGFSFGFVLFGPIGYIFKHYIWIQVAMLFPFLPLFFAYKFIPESPRWLIMHKKLNRLKKLIVSAAKRNGKELKEDPNEILIGLVKGKATHPYVPNILYFIMAVTSGFFALWLPETSNKTLTDSLEEAEE